jgi:molecular chaperone DnaJ
MSLKNIKKEARKMRNPYEVLGLPENATDEQIREAYRTLARRYQQEMAEGSGRGNPAEKMDELDKAYDSIIMSRSSGFGGGDYRAHSSSSQSGGYSVNTDFSDIRTKIQNSRFDDAEMLLDGIPEQSRNAEWYFLKGSIQYRKGWLEEAGGNFAAAVRLDPGNKEYRAAYDNMRNSSSGGYRMSGNKGHSGCSACDICTGLLCADCCCECMGGDLIRCC